MTSERKIFSPGLLIPGEGHFCLLAGQFLFVKGWCTLVFAALSMGTRVGAEAVPTHLTSVA